MKVSRAAISRIIRNIRRFVYQGRETGLPPNILKIGSADFLIGDINIRDDKFRLRDVLLPEEVLDERALFAPDIGLRMLGERELALVANEQLHLLWQEGIRVSRGESKKEPMTSEWPYRRSINELIRVFGDADATPFVEDILDQLIEEDMINESLYIIREVVREYLKLYDDKGLVWFLGQTLPLVALFSDANSLHQNSVNVVQAFSPNAHYGWNSYATIMEEVRSIIDPCRINRGFAPIIR